ncbi:MAG: YicC family protein [Deltaproteobacteria bacterium]|nr:YicC family protein [Deltaproteobacteria bacterium]
MTKSMTGYGSGCFNAGGRSFSVEVKSVNHRYIDFSMRVPERLIPGLEGKIRAAIKAHFSRGYFSIAIYPSGAEERAVELNLDLAREYHGALVRLHDELALDGKVDLSHIISFKDIFSSPGGEQSIGEEGGDAAMVGLLQAITILSEMRGEEGAALSRDITGRLASLEGSAGEIEERTPMVADRYRERLMGRIASLEGVEFDEGRLLTEVALFAERSNITEELVRIRSHVEQFRALLKLSEPVGRRLDFLCQEIQREVNTIASKANDLEISHSVVEMKGELEKIREQVQNIE